MTISTVVPAFNVESLIEPTLRSALSQTSPPDEIIVIDDGSTDGTVAVARRLAKESGGLIKLVETPHRGPGAARNAGVRYAAGEWIAFLDGDDLWLPGKIEHLREAIEANPWADIISHDEIEVGSDGTETSKPLHERFDPSVPLTVQLYRSCFLSTSCMTARRELVLKVGGFDEELMSAQDYDLWLKLSRTGTLVFIPEILAKYIVRDRSISTNLDLRHRALMHIAYSHAPYVASAAGSTSARMLRARSVLLAYRFLGPRGLMNPRMPIDLLRAVIAPLQ